MKGIVSRIKVAVFIPDEPPQEYLEKWKESMKRAGPKMGQGIKEAISGVGDYAQKIAKPNIKATINWLNPKYRTKHGRTYKTIINSMLANMPNGYKKFKGKTDRAFETIDGEEAKRFSEKIEVQAYRVALRRSRLLLPFTGYKDQIRGVAPFVIRWLSGDQTAKKLITDADKLFVGGPCRIIADNKESEFKQKFYYRIQQAGARIVKSGYRAMRAENDLTNKLVNQYIQPDIVPFIAGGPSSRLGRDSAVASHIDFVILNDKLYLEIQVTQKS